MMAPKKLFAAALASLPLVVFGQTPAAAPAEPAKPAAPPPVQVQVYGTLNVNTQYTQASDATDDAVADVAGRMAVSTDSSNIGVRANVELGIPGYKGTAQCETSANVDGISVAGFCNRNSRLGITTPYGTLWYGNWDTPFKAAAYGTKADDPFGNTDVYGFQGIMGSPGNNYRSGAFISAARGTAATPPAGSTVGGFDLRAQNSVGFHSAKFSGLSFKLQYAVAEFASPDGALEPQLFGAVVNYDNGPLSVYAAYENHQDALGIVALGAGDSTAGSSDWAWRVGAGYELALPFGPLTVGAMVDQLFFSQENSPDLTDYSRLAWHVSAKQRMGNHELRARYSMALDGEAEVAGGDSDTVDDTGAMMIALGYAYHFTPSFQLYASAAQILNEDVAQYTFSIGGAPAVAGATAEGQDPLAVGVGFRYAF